MKTTSPGVERADQECLDVHLERAPDDRPVERHRRHDPIQRQPRDQRRRPPVTMRERHAQALTARAAAVRARHLKGYYHKVFADHSWL